MKWLLVAMMLASVADIATTEVAIGQGLYEYNPLMQNTGVRIGSKLAMPLVIYWATRNSPRRRRIGLCLLATGIWSTMAGWNIGVTIAWGGK